jgi:putative protease
MSPKDMCTIGFIDKIIEAGAGVLKIEGRGRSPEYVKIATECYRRAVDAYFSGNYNDELISSLNSRLDSVYNRGFWHGYYLGKEMIELTDRYGSSATKKKVYVGKIMNYYARVNAAEMLVESEAVKTGDEIMIIGPTTGVVELAMPEMRKDENNKLTEAHKGYSIAFYSSEIVRKSDKVYKLISRKI